MRSLWTCNFNESSTIDDALNYQTYLKIKISEIVQDQGIQNK